MSDRKESLSDFGRNVGKRLDRLEFEGKTAAKRTDEYLENRVKDLAFLSGRAHSWKGKEEKKIEEAALKSHKLYVWGFGEQKN